MSNDISSLFTESVTFNDNGFHPLPIGIKKPAEDIGEKWTDKRGTVADNVYLEKYFCNNQSVKRVAIILNSIKMGFAFDVDGYTALDIFRRKILPRVSPALRDKIAATTHTKSASGGLHWLFQIERKDFQDGISSKSVWKNHQNQHDEIKLIGTNQYLIERGEGYEKIRGIEDLILLSKEEVDELLSVLDRFTAETNAIKNIDRQLVKYWKSPDRNEIVLGTSGFLYKNGVDKYIERDWMEHLISVAALSDDNLVKTMTTIENTYAKNLKTDKVAGYTKLIAAVDNDRSLITTVQNEFGKLGFNFFDAEIGIGQSQQQSAEAEELPKITTEDITFVIDTMTKEAPHDRESIKQLLLGMLSAFTKLPLHHAISSRDSGSGKSYLLVLVSGYLPKKYVVSLTGMSDKALLHKNGILVVEDEETGELKPLNPILKDIEEEIEELQVSNGKGEIDKDAKNRIRELEALSENLKNRAEKLIILENKIMLLLDTTQDNLFNALMSMVSQDTTEDQKYEFVDTSGKIKTRVNRFRGIPSIFTCQVIDDSRQQRYEEKNRRFIHVIPETSQNKIHTAKHQICRKHGLLPEEYDEQVVNRVDKDRAKNIVKVIVSKLIKQSKFFQAKESAVRIPFLDGIACGIDGDSSNVWTMTVTERINKYLEVTTKLNMDSRPRIIDTESEGGGRIYPIATFEDLAETLQLMKRASSTLRPYIVDWYNEFFIPCFNSLKGEPLSLKVNGTVITTETHVGVNTDMLGTLMAETLHIPKPSSKDLMYKYIYPLYNLGIIDKVQSSIDKRGNILFPVNKEGNISGIFKDGDDPRLTVIDPAFFPSKNVLEYSLRTIKVWSYRVGGVAHQKYRLVDPEGIDITVDELIERYLSIPEICFKQGWTEPAIVFSNLNYLEVIQKNILSLPPLSCTTINQQFSKNEIEVPSSPYLMPEAEAKGRRERLVFIQEEQQKQQEESKK